MTEQDIIDAAEHADIMWSGADVPFGWLRHFVDAFEKSARTWVGLTDEQIAEIAAQGHQRWVELAHAIEAKLKEKNT